MRSYTLPVPTSASPFGECATPSCKIDDDAVEATMVMVNAS